MKQLKKIILYFSFLFLLESCAVNVYLESYEPINVFLETQKINKDKKYILQRDKAGNKEALRIFNGGEGIAHIIDPSDKKDYTDGLFEEKHWRKMYRAYIHDTVPKYWKKQDFPQYEFILEDGKGLFKYDFLMKYSGTGLNEALIISEPMFYNNKKYIVFYYAEVSSGGAGDFSAVIMKKENKKWVVVKRIGDYVFY